MKEEENVDEIPSEIDKRKTSKSERFLIMKAAFLLFRYAKNVKTEAKRSGRENDTCFCDCSQRSNCVFDPDDSVTETEHISHISFLFLHRSLRSFSLLLSHFFFLMTCPTVE